MSRRPLARVLAALLLLLPAVAAHAQGFVEFESGQVRPLALSPDGSTLFACNTPDDRLEIFSVGAGGLAHVAAVPVGLEPVAVAARTNTEVWVVNHLSDSISIVDVGSTPPRVVRTLLVGDEPRDIVFAGPGRTRAFITTAHRGQNSPLDPQLTTEGVGRADVWVFDALNLGVALGGTPLTIVTLFGDTPRALAASPDGNTVYAAVFHSGNRTTSLFEGLVCDGGASAGPCSIGGATMPGGLPAPNTNFQGIPQHETGLIVKFDPAAGAWKDELGRNWNNAVKFTLPDQDVFTIDASAPIPGSAGQAFVGVGTVLFNMIVNPANGKVYVTNTEARNEVRFEGPGTFAGHTVRGHLHEARVTVLDGASVLPRHLNKHINYAVVPSPPATKAASLATPVGMAIDGAGTTLYVAAFGSSKIGVFSTSALEADTFTPDPATHITVSGGGPSGLVLDEARGRLYVLTRFDNALSVVETSTRSELQHLALFNPEPASVVNGRAVLYDARLTSSNGEASCAACHIFGDFDSLGWDLGNPDDTVLNNPNPIRLNVGADPDFHPMKGPMTTQSLRGMANHGPMHWRGDRTAGNDPGGDPLDEAGAFKKFIVAFDGLLGRGGPISSADMDRFTSFILQVTYPPNPIRPLDNQLTGDALAGRNLFFGRTTDGFGNCNSCHVLNPAAGFFGSDGFTTFENEPQLFKIAHLRNLYQKVGKFGMPPNPGLFQGGDVVNLGDQVRGFGFLHDGSVDTIFHFHQAVVFTVSTTEARQLEQFMLQFDSNLAPIVGQQITLDASNGGTVGARIALLEQRAGASECEVVAKGNVGGAQRGWLRLTSGMYRSDRSAEPLLTSVQLRTLAQTPGQELTFTCVPPGSGQRIGIDRDGDGVFDGDEGTTPGLTLIQTKSLVLKDRTTPPDPAKRKITFTSKTKLDPSANRIVAPAPGSSGDPTVGGGVLTVYDAAGLSADKVTVSLAAGRWHRIGSASRPKGWQFASASPTDPVQKVKVKADLIAVKGGKANWGYTLNESAQGRVALRLTLGTTGTGWCADAPAKESGNPPSTAKNDHADKFVAQPRTPAPATCPASASGAFLDD
ncbi:MAG: hypothetical protein U0807_05425 [Candidatus Binatia bacterium]